MRDIIILIVGLVILLWLLDVFGCNETDLETFDANAMNKEAIDDLTSVYTKDLINVTNMNVTNNMEVVNQTKTKDLNVSNNLEVANSTKTKDLQYTGGVSGPTSLKADGNVTLQGGKTISAPGRLHIGGDELLYLLNKSGVVVGKEWGGNGNLSVQGNITGPSIDAINNGKVSRGHKIFYNRHYGGWDLTNFSGTSNIQNCADRCRPSKALAAVRRKSDGHCWCKNLSCSGGNSNDYDLALVDYGN